MAVKRVLRFNGKSKKKIAKPSLAAADMTAEKIIESAKELDVETVATSISQGEIKNLVEWGGVKNAEKKRLETDIKIVKEILLFAAKKENKKEGYKTAKYGAPVSPKNKTVVGTATDLARVLKKLGKMGLFDELVTVKITEVKKYIGEETLKSEGFLTIEKEDFASIRFKTQ